MSSTLSLLLRLDVTGTTLGESFDCSNLSAAGVQWTMHAGTAGATEIEVMGSNDNSEFHSLEFPKTMTAPGHSGQVEVSAYKYLRVYVTVPAGTSDYPVGQFTFYGIVP